MLRNRRRAFLTAAPSPHGNSRTVEYLLALLLVGWGATVACYSHTVLSGPTTKNLLMVASAPTWAALALGVGLLRITALVINGAWQRTPLLRFAGAAVGLMWWTTLGALYLDAIMSGAPTFPNLSIYPIFVFFEAYSCFRCGQDANFQNSLGVSNAPRSGLGSNG